MSWLVLTFLSIFINMIIRVYIPKKHIKSSIYFFVALILVILTIFFIFFE